MSVRIKALLGVAAAGLAASALFPMPAQAAGNNFAFCNISSAPEYVSFPYRGWFSSTIQNPGQCWSHSFSGLTSDEAVGYRLVNGYWLAVATRYFNDSEVVYFNF